MSMEMVERRLRMPKTTGTYVSLDNPMIRDILWDKTYLDPATNEYVRMLQDNVPKEMAIWRGTAMTGVFSNHSRLKLQGYFQNGRDKNGVGTAFQDYAFTELALFTREDPLPRLMPILSNEAEEKKLMVASTPRGKRRNPLWQLMQSFDGSKDFKVIIRTIDDLNEIMRRHGLPPVRTQAQLEQDRDAYRKRFGNDRMFEQEYYCSFEEMDAAAVYGEAFMKLVEEKRVFDFNLDPASPVYVCSTSAPPACTRTPQAGSHSSGSTVACSSTTAARATARRCLSTWTCCGRSPGSTGSARSSCRGMPSTTRRQSTRRRPT